MIIETMLKTMKLYKNELEADLYLCRRCFGRICRRQNRLART